MACFRMCCQDLGGKFFAFRSFHGCSTIWAARLKTLIYHRMAWIWIWKVRGWSIVYFFIRGNSLSVVFVFIWKFEFVGDSECQIWYLIENKTVRFWDQGDPILSLLLKRRGIMTIRRYCRRRGVGGGGGGWYLYILLLHFIIWVFCRHWVSYMDGWLSNS